MDDFIVSMQEFVNGVDPLWQLLAVAGVSTFPFIESYFGSFIGVMAGISPYLAAPAAIAGNWISMYFFVTSAAKARGLVTKEHEEAPQKRQKKVARLLNKYGVPGVSLLGQGFLPSQLSSAAMVSLGSEKKRVIFWQTISICIWGVVFAILGVYGIELLQT